MLHIGTQLLVTFLAGISVALIRSRKNFKTKELRAQSFLPIAGCTIKKHPKMSDETFLDILSSPVSIGLRLISLPSTVAICFTTILTSPNLWWGALISYPLFLGMLHVMSSLQESYINHLIKKWKKQNITIVTRASQREAGILRD